MIGLLLLQAGIGAIGRHALPPRGCAAFLWSRDATPRLVAMAGAEPGTLKIQLDGRALVLPRITAEGSLVRGLSATSRYAAGTVSATLTMTAAERPDLADGALVSDALLTIEEAGKDVIVAPVGGMIGCAPTGSGGR